MAISMCCVVVMFVHRYLEVRRSQTRHGIPTGGGTKALSTAGSSLDRTSDTAGIVARGDVVEGLRIRGPDLVQERCNETTRTQQTICKYEPLSDGQDTIRLTPWEAVRRPNANHSTRLPWPRRQVPRPRYRIHV